jgi:thiol-disulfide isomerase/thioredoxin
VLAEYLRLQGSEASRLSGTDPDGATRILASARLLAAESVLKEQPAVKAAVAMYAPLERRIESARLQLQMIGKPAPALDVAATVHGNAVTAEALQGKVVLLDFWAVWCGPCIATFPHLNSMYDEFHSRGLEIVGVTRQYGYQWNSETKRASRAEGEVSQEAELAMLEEFMKHHELRHPTIVTPQESEMQKQFGVTGIPHAVLIDRKGNVRMIKVGSGEANAKALHDMVQTLLAE